MHHHRQRRRANPTRILMFAGPRTPPTHDERTITPRNPNIRAAARDALRIILSCAALLFSAVAGPVLAGDNPTVFPFQIDQDALTRHPLKKVVIASAALGKPARQYLREHEAQIDAAVSAYLSKNDITVVDNSQYRRALDDAQRRLGAPYDPSTDRMDMTKQQQILGAVFAQLRQTQPTLDGIVFTELVSREVYFSSGLKRMARWDGVSRSPRLQGPADGVSTDFNWVQPVDAVSLGVYVFTPEGQRVFMSAGGLSLTESIDTSRSKARFTRSRKVLSNKAEIKEGVKLALHPWIPMKRYPGKD